MLELVTLGNIILLWDYYNYYLLLHKVTSGVFVGYKMVKVSIKLYDYLKAKYNKELSKRQFDNEWELV